MIQFVAEGLFCGLLLSLLLGPVFVGLIHTSMREGFGRGVLYAVGVAISDVVFIFLSYFGIAHLVKIPGVETGFYLLGGVILFFFGLYYLLKKQKQTIEISASSVSQSSRGPLLRGFLMNAINPAVLFFWIGVVGVVDSKAEQNMFYAALFLASSVGMVFMCDVLKSFLAHKISVFINDVWLVYLNRFLGFMLCFLGVKFVWEIIACVL